MALCLSYAITSVLLGKAGRGRGVMWSRTRGEVWTDNTKHWTWQRGRPGGWDDCLVLGHDSGSREGAREEDMLLQESRLRR